MYRLITLFCFVTVGFSTYSQELYQPSFELKNNHTENTTFTYKATDYISLLPGFHYKPNQNNYLKASIDKSGIPDPVYDELYDNQSFTNRELNKTLQPILASGSHEVSSSGAVTYTVPIILPSGTNGMQPNLTISYNSQSGNGLLGLGWHLSGLSAIQRIGKNLYFDGVNQPVLNNATDNFSLDGNYLKLIDGSKGAAESTYATEEESYVVVTAKGTAGGGPDWFEVRTKDGKTIEYGKTVASKTVGSNGSVLTWRINKIIDAYGNYVIFDYQLQNNEVLIEKIQYTGNENESLAPYNEVKFHYSKREDKHHGYFAGSVFRKEHLLVNIELLSNNEVVKNYRFKYGFKFYTLLNEIQEYAGTGENLNSTIFKYNYNTSSLEHHLRAYSIDVSDFETPQVGLTKQWALYPGDFNGDGLTDYFGLLYEWQYSTDHSKARYEQLAVFINNHQNGGSGFEYHPIPILPTYIRYGGNWQDYDKDEYFPLMRNDLNRTEFMFGDLNGDAKDDIIIKHNGDNQSPPYTETDRVYYNALLSNAGTGYAGFYEASDYMDLPDNRNEHGNYNRSAATLGDFDGDGILELFAMSLRTMDVTIKSFDGRVGIFDESNVNEDANIQNGHLTPIDYDGDGTTELIYYSQHSSASGVRYLNYNLVNNTLYRESLTSGSLIHHNWQEKYFSGNRLTDITKMTDFNGDGIEDLFIIGEYGRVAIKYGVGKQNNKNFSDNSFIDASNELDLTVNSSRVFLRDINSDGKSDIIKVNSSDLTIYLSKGYDNQFEIHTKALIPLVDLNGYNMWDFVDLDGDGNLEITVTWRESSTFYVHDLYTKFKAEEKLLVSVKNGFNNRVDFDYATASQQTNYSTTYRANQNFFTHPLTTLKGAMPLAQKTTEYLPDNTQAVKNFSYHDGVVHKEGKGFIGFQKLTVEDELNQLTTVLDNSYVVGYLRPFNYKKTITKELNDGSTALISKVRNYFDVVNIDNDRFKLELTSSVDYSNELRDGNINTYNSYDDFGNVIFTKTSYLDGSYTQTTVNQYLSTAGTVPNVPDVITLKKYVAESSTGVFEVVTDHNYGLNGNSSLAYTETLSGGKTVKTTFNAFGNVSATEASKENDNELVTENFTYDATQRFVETSTNPIGDVISYTYNRFGNIATETNAVGLVTTYTYDDFGALQSTELPDGNKIHTTKGWDFNQDGGASSLFYTLSTSQGQPYKKNYFDRFGREVRAETIDRSGTKLFVDKTYTDKGQLASETLPYKDGQIADVITYGYDEYGRSTTISNARNGLVTTTSYPSRDKVKVANNIPNSLAVTTKYNDLGLAINVKEGDNSQPSVSYSYHSSGQAESITAAGLTTTIGYDEYGQQETLTDPNTGTFNYSYNALGQLDSQTDAESNTYEIDYDELGRISSKTDPNGLADAVSYEYFDAGNGKGQLKNVKLNGNIKESNTYDELGRLATQTTHIDASHTYTTTTTYNDLGQLETYTYPGGFTLSYEYDAIGNITKIKGGKQAPYQTIWQYATINDNGQITGFYLNEGKLFNQRQYDAHGYPEKFKAIDNNTSQTLFEYDFEFNAQTGNLEYRSDRINNLTETFVYDQYDRLTSVYSDINMSIQALDMVYDDVSNNGNISSKSDVGMYQYQNVQRPHTPSHIDVDNTNSTNLLNLNLDHDIVYTAFDKTKEINSGNFVYRLSYGPGEHREQLVVEENQQAVYTKYYAAQYEEIAYANGTVEKLHYINTPTGLSAIYVEDNAGQGTIYFIQQDYLGSILSVIDAQNAVEQQLSYDAWGRRRNPTNWSSYDLSGNEPLFDRGYTGHEHYDAIGLTNMNGRMYDPLIGLMLSPDNYVQNPGYAHSYNRYSYVLNNPLKYTDPSGEIVWAPIIIGAALGGFSGWQIGKAKGSEGWEMAGYIFGGAAIGGISGGTASAISTAGGGAYISGAVGGAIGNGGFAALREGNIAQGVATGFISGGVGGMFGAAIGGGGGAFAGGAVGSGLNAKLNGASWSEAGKAALGGGAIAFGAYHASSYIGWKFQGGNKIGGHDISYRQYTVMQADFQRSRFWKIELGGYLLEGGGVHRASPGTSSQVDIGPVPQGEVAFAEYHTHWDKPGITRYVIHGGDGNYVDPYQVALDTPAGQRVALDKFKTSRYHGDWDYNTGGRPSIVINRYDGSYYSGSGTSYSVVNPPINRFVYSFLFWR